MASKKNQGFSLVELLITTALIGIVGYIASDFFIHILREERIVSTNSNIMEVRNGLVSFIRDDSSWLVTRQQSPFSCWNSASGDCSSLAGTTNSFTPLDAEGNRYHGSYNPAGNGTHGFDENGEFCSNYSTTTPNRSCPFRFDFTWEPICGPSSCIRPAIRVNMTFSNSYSGKPPLIRINQSALNGIIIRRGEAVSVVPDTCPAGFVVISVDPATGFITCSDIETL